MRIPDTIDTVVGLVLFAVSAANGDRPLVFLGCALIFAVIYGARCWGPAQIAASYAAILRALRGKPSAAPVVTSRTLAHRNAPGHDGLTISVAVPTSPLGVPTPGAPPPSVFDAPAVWQAGSDQAVAVQSLTTTIRQLNDMPDDVPHWFCLGGTGAGKSTFARLCLALRVQRGEQFVILTGKRTMLFADVPSVGRDVVGDDGNVRFTRVRAACRALLVEVARRDNVPIHQRRFTPLTIVIDDATIILQEVNEAADMVRAVALIGRELSMRLMILTGSILLKELNLEGRGDIREHFAVVEYHKRLDGSRETALRPRFSEKIATPFDAMQVPQAVVSLAISAAAEWGPTRAYDPQLSRQISSPLGSTGSGSDEPGLIGSAQQYAGSAVGSGSVQPVQPVQGPPETLPANRTELQQIVKALTLYQQTGKETEAIEQAFGVTKGGTAAYQRARALFKTALQAGGNDAHY